MFKHVGLLSLIIVLLSGCQTSLQNQEQPLTVKTLQTSKLDSIKSVVTVILNNGNDLMDTWRGIQSGTYAKDENDTIRSINFIAEELLIDSLTHQLTIDMVNIERYDSTQLNYLKIDSSFFLKQVSHLALSNITLDDITNEVLIPIQMAQDSSKIYVEAKTTLMLEDWGFDLSEEHKLHLGLSLYSLSEK